MLSRRSMIAIVLASSALAAGDAFAQNQAIVGIQTATTYNADVRITAVDPSARTVAVIYSDGAMRTYKANPAVANLATAKVGDAVSIGFEEKRTFVLSGPNTKTPIPGSASVAAAVSAGQSTVGVYAMQSIGNWWVVSVDPGANTITLVSPNSGPVRTFNVTNQADREQLSRVKAGDNLTDINTELAVVSITPKA